MNKIRQIIREEVYRVMQEIGEDPLQLSKEMIQSNEQQVKELEAELKFRQNDTKVSGLSPEDKKARIAIMNITQKRLENAKIELEMAKQSQLNAVKMQQTQDQAIEPQQTENPAQSQIMAQT
ncbi:MAG: hypothetical protein AABY15_07360 [Nanoarchaeota archaeon]